MHILNKISSSNAILARRAIGAMFFSVFGAAWIMLWIYRSHRGNVPTFFLVALVALVILGFCRQRYVRYRDEFLAEVNKPEQAHARRVFRIINSIQWTLIIIIGNVLANKGFSDWIIPSVILVIGVHFVPLAKLFSYPPHYVTGAALILLALVYPVLEGPRDSVGCLATGLVLWTSAIWAIWGTQSRISTQLS